MDSRRRITVGIYPRPVLPASRSVPISGKVVNLNLICSRVVHGSDGPAGRVGSGHDFTGFGGSGRVSTSDFLVFY